MAGGKGVDALPLAGPKGLTGREGATGKRVDTDMAENPRSKEGLQRVQIGLTGLVGVLLLVGLANIAVQRVGEGIQPTDAFPANSTANVANATDGKPNDPLGDLGVTPVPDLQPDPKLNKPMDREPTQN